MRDCEGWYFKKEKAWTFPIKRFQKVYDALKDAGYTVNTTMEVPKPSRERKVTKKESFSNPDVIAVYDVCEKCGLDNFVGRDGLCSLCRSKE